MTKYIYKKSVTTQNYTQVGEVVSVGIIDFNTPVDKNIILPDYYYPEFYYDSEVTKSLYNQNYDLEDIYVVSIGKESFIPKNLPQQIVTLKGHLRLKPNEYYVTGYVTDEGKVIYYDQFIK